MKRKFGNVWDSIEDTPQQAASQRAKAELMMEIERIIQQRGMTQAEATNMPQQ
jgi:predicted XRE-type DNA-binding protein